jgi:hypothetical protein
MDRTRSVNCKEVKEIEGRSAKDAAGVTQTNE